MVTFTTSTNPNLILTADEAYDLDNDMLFGNNLESIELKDVGSKDYKQYSPKHD